MWPFSTAGRDAGLNYRRIDDDFSISGQITPDAVKEVAEAGFRTILCARPDREESGQPPFSEIERAARENGLMAVQIPISGSIGEGAIIRMSDVLAKLPKPIFAYCRSGARAGSLYAAGLRAQRG